MAYHDPGSVRWAQQGRYTNTLCELLNQNITKGAAQSLFNTSNRKSQERLNALSIITKALFTAGGEEGTEARRVREKKLSESLDRRLTHLAKEYRADITYISSDNKSLRDRMEYLTTTQQLNPYWENLSNILKDHEQFPEFNVDDFIAAMLNEPPEDEEEDEEGDDEEDGYDDHYFGFDGDEEDEEDEDDPMEGIGMAQPVVPVPIIVPDPNPFPRPQQQQAQQPRQQFIPEDLSLCPKCEAQLPDDPDASTDHIKRCLEGDVSSEETLSCCICEIVFTAEETEEMRQSHVDDCFKAGLKGVGGDSENGRGKNKSEDYICDGKNVPQDSECSICFEPFLPGELLTRLLDCCCIFHQSGLTKWWSSKLQSSRNNQHHGGMEVEPVVVGDDGRRCPLHSH